MTSILLIPRLSVIIFMGLSLLLAFILIIQLSNGCCNAIASFRRKNQINQHSIYNFYLFHHLIVCIIRCLTIFLICLFLIIYHECLSLDILIHFLLLLSTFDIFLIIIGETVHFWDCTINHKSTLYSKCCFIFGICFNYFLSSLFLAIHMTLGGNHPVIVHFCQTRKTQIIFHQTIEYEKSLIPTMILYVLFILLNFLTFLWIHISYKDIAKLKRKRLATVFFYSLVLTKFQNHQRARMVNQTLKRLSSICLFLLSNIIVILPVLTMKILKISISNVYLQIFIIFFTQLPWCESLTCIFFNEMILSFPSKLSRFKEKHQIHERIGIRLSSYRNNSLPMNKTDHK